MRRDTILSSRFNGGYNVSGNHLDSPDETLGVPSRNQVYIGTGWKPWRGLAPQAANSGSRLMRQVGETWGGLKDYGSGPVILGKGSLFSDIGRSLWHIGSGQVSIEGVDLTGITASTVLQVSIAVAGVYSAGNTFTAGLPIPAAPDVGVSPTAGLITGAVSVKIARLRLTTGARSVASTTSAVVTPASETLRVTFPSPSTGQTHWAVFVTQQGFGGVGLHYRLAYNGALDIPIGALGTVDGFPDSLRFDFQDGDLVPEVAYIDDYAPPAGTHAVRIQNVMNVLGAYGDSTTPVSSSSPGTAGAVSLPNFYESYKPSHVIFFPEAVVDVLARPSDANASDLKNDFAYVGHRSSVTALQYVGPRDGPATSVTTVWPDIGIKFPHNWCQVHGLLHVMSAKNGLVRMRHDGSVDYDWSDPVRAYMANWTQDDTFISWHPDTMNVVVFNKTTQESISYSLQRGKWSTPQYFSDAGVVGGAMSCIPSAGRLFLTVDNGSSYRAYAWHEGATSMPIGSFTNWKETSGPATIMEIGLAFESDMANKPMIISIHRNLRPSYVRDASVTSGSGNVDSLSSNFNSSYIADVVCIFAPNIGGAGVNFLIARTFALSSTRLTMADPVTGAPITSPVTASGLYMILATEIFTYTIPQLGVQHTPPLTDRFVDDALSFQIGLTMFTGATAGQLLSVKTKGVMSGMPTALVT